VRPTGFFAPQFGDAKMLAKNTLAD
jgi:hypothetical protein